MKTDQLIRGLVADLPTPSGSVAATLALSLALASTFSVVAMLACLGLRPELSHVITSGPFWLKVTYTFALGTTGLCAIERLGRPGTTAAHAVMAACAVVAIIAITALAEFMLAPPGARTAMLLGRSASFCPVAIVALSAPLLMGAFIALNRLAPTNYTLAGAAAGLTAGGYGACIYSLHCTEYGMPFLATWYTLGMALMVAAGALLSRFLRW